MAIMSDPLEQYSKPVPFWRNSVNYAVLRVLNLLVSLRRSAAGPTPETAAIRRLLIIKLFGVGDLVLILPTVQALRKALPGSSITLLTSGLRYEVFKRNSLFDRVISWEPVGCTGWWRNLESLKGDKFNAVLDFEQRSVKSLIISAATQAPVRVGFMTDRSRGRRVAYTHPVLYNSNQHMVDTFADIARVLGPIGPFDALIPLEVSDEAISRAHLFLNEFVGARAPVVGIQAGCSPVNLSQRIWDLEKFAAFADGVITNCNAAVVFTGGADEADLNQEILGRMHHQAINAAGKLTMEETVALISGCNLFLSSDTGTVHVAAAQGVPTIGLYGPDSPIRYSPFGAGNRAFHKWVPCSPCNHAEYGIVGGCVAKTCLRGIEPDEVLEEALGMLQRSSNHHLRVFNVGSECEDGGL